MIAQKEFKVVEVFIFDQPIQNPLAIRPAIYIISHKHHRIIFIDPGVVEYGF